MTTSSKTNNKMTKEKKKTWKCKMTTNGDHMWASFQFNEVIYMKCVACGFIDYND